MTSSRACQRPALEKRMADNSTRTLFKIFRVLGILTPRKHPLIVNIVLAMILPIDFAISYFVTSEKMNIAQVLTSLQISIIICACAGKLIVIGLARDIFLKMELILEKLNERIRWPEEIHQVRKNTKNGQRLLGIFICVYFLYGTCTCLGAVLSGQPPYSLYIPYLNWRDSTRNFIIASALEYLLVNISSFQNVMNDSYAVIYIGIVQTHMKILSMRVQRIGIDSKRSVEENFQDLVLCIQDHKNIIELIDTISTVISKTVFIQFMVSAMALSVCLTNIAVFGNESTVFGCALFILGVVAETLPICYFVSNLVAEGNRLTDAIFHMNWMDQNRTFRRMCIFFIHRSQQTLIIRAGKMIPITLGSFLSMVKFSFSLYTLLSEMDFTEAPKRHLNATNLE